MDRMCKCGCEDAYVEKTQKSVIVQGETLQVDAYVRKCKSCNLEIDNPVMTNKLSLAIKNGSYIMYGIAPKDISSFRKQNKITREELGKALGYQSNEIRRFEKGKAIQPLEFRRQLNVLMNVNNIYKKSEIH